MNNVKVKIHRFIKDKLGVDESAITDSASFYDDLDVDSLDFCELIVDIEREFNIAIPDDIYGKFKTVGLLVNYVAKQTNSEITKLPETGNVLEESLSA